MREKEIIGKASREEDIASRKYFERKKLGGEVNERGQ